MFTLINFIFQIDPEVLEFIKVLCILLLLILLEFKIGK